MIRTFPILYQKPHFELQHEDGFIKKPKHVVNMIFQVTFDYILYNENCIRLNVYIK
jgi:hypothetical protein